MPVDITEQPAEMGRRTLRQTADYTGPASYLTGGDPIDPNDLRMGRIIAVLGLTISNGTLVLHGWWNPTTLKIMWFVAAGTQVSNATDLSTYTGTIEFIGV